MQRPFKPFALTAMLWASLVLTGACGGLVLLKPAWLATLTRWAYTGFDIGLTLVTLLSVVAVLLRLGRPAELTPTPQQAR